MIISSRYMNDSFASHYFVNPQSPAALWVKQHRADPRAIPIQKNLASTPTAIWLLSIKEKTELADEINGYLEDVQKQKAEPILVILDTY